VPVRILGRRTYSQSKGSPFNTGAPAAPPKSEGGFSLNDAYLEYRRRLDANQLPVSPIDNGSPAAPLVPSGVANFSGRLPGRIAAIAGIDPQNPNRFAPPSPVLGIFSGKPMPNVSIPPPIFGLLDDSRANRDDDENWYTRWRRSIGIE
jgi:hypothetical protein